MDRTVPHWTLHVNLTARAPLLRGHYFLTPLARGLVVVVLPRVTLAIVAVLVLAVSPTTLAGTKTAPEVTDPANDQAVEGAVPISTQPPSGTTSVGLNADLLGGWVDRDVPASLTFNVLLQGTGNPTSSSTTTWTFHFETGGKPYDASATQDFAAPAGTGTIKPGGVASGAVAAGDSIIQLLVLKSAIGDPVPGAVLTNLYATSEGKQGGVVPKGVTDRAPNTGAGTDYVIAGQVAQAAAGPAVFHTTLDKSPLTIQQAFTSSTNATYLYNWTVAPASVHLTLESLTAKGSAAITVRDAENKTVFSRAAGGAANSNLDVSGAAGTWKISIVYQAFQGNLTLTMGPKTSATSSATSTSGTTSASKTTTGTGTHSTTTGGTGTSSTTSKGSPAIGYAAGIALLATIALARRRLA